MVSFTHKHFTLAPPLVLLGGECSSGGLSRWSLAVKECQVRSCSTGAQISVRDEPWSFSNRVWPVGERGIQRRYDEYYDFSTFQAFDELTEWMARNMFLEIIRFFAVAKFLLEWYDFFNHQEYDRPRFSSKIKFSHHSPSYGEFNKH